MEKDSQAKRREGEELSTTARDSTPVGCCYWTCWINRFPSANPLRAGFFVIGEIEEAIFSWREAPSDFFCWHLHSPLYARTVQLHLAVVALKRKAAARGKRAPRASSIVGWFFQLPWQASGAESAAPSVCHLALVAARAPLAGSGEDAQHERKPATIAGGPAGAGRAWPWPRCGVRELLFHVQWSD
jgi:hypothetical protein